MSGFVVVGTDTDAGKTTFSLLFLTAFPEQFAYWKPVETGESDTAKVRQLVPRAVVCDARARFDQPVAPALAAKVAGRAMPDTAELLAAVPRVDRPLLVETFGGVLSPLTEDVLQAEFIRELGRPVVLVASSAVGAVGRVLAALAGMKAYQLRPEAIVMLGPDDPFATEQIVRHSGGVAVFGLRPPVGNWMEEAFRRAAEEQRDQLERLNEQIHGAAKINSISGTGVPPVSLQNKDRRDAGPTEQAIIGMPTTPGFTDRDRGMVWHPYSSLQSPDPLLPVVATEDEFLILADGRRIVDGISSWWTILHGHRQSEIMHAIRAATYQLDHVIFAGATHPDAVELAEGILGSMPWSAGGRLFYSDNGSTAVEVALKMAYQFWCHRGEPGRTLFVGFENGYHGDTFGAMSVGRNPVFFGRFEPLLFKAVQIPASPAALDEVLHAHPGEVAAVVIEPLVQGAGGMKMHSPDDLRAIFDVARKHGVLFIADEVMTGFGRTGSLWAFDQAGITPDLVCMAKGITGGVLPLAATAVSPRVVAEFDTPNRDKTFFHGHSFTANPIACAAAVASWNLMRTGRWSADVIRIVQFWNQAIRPLDQLAGVREVRIRGLIAAVELDVPGGYLADVGALMRRTCLDAGVLLRPLGNVLYAMPPLCTSGDSLTRIVDAMSCAIRACGLR